MLVAVLDNGKGLQADVRATVVIEEEHRPNRGYFGPCEHHRDGCAEPATTTVHVRANGVYCMTWLCDEHLAVLRGELVPA